VLAFDSDDFNHAVTWFAVVTLLPKWILDWLYANGLVGCIKSHLSVLYLCQSIEDGANLSGLSCRLWITHLFRGSWAFWAVTTLDAGDKHLLWVVAAVDGKDWVAIPNHTITTCHMESRDSECNKWLSEKG